VTAVGLNHENTCNEKQRSIASHRLTLPLQTTKSPNPSSSSIEKSVFLYWSVLICSSSCSSTVVVAVVIAKRIPISTFTHPFSPRKKLHPPQNARVRVRLCIYLHLHLRYQLPRSPLPFSPRKQLKKKSFTRRRMERMSKVLRAKEEGEKSTAVPLQRGK
jgi:hypothetical protein